MGKPTGFLEYARREDPRRSPAERVQDWEEFHIALPDAVREQQGGRCMNCGVPFCQTGMLYEGRAFGCPLHNLIPEWNDMILSGNRGHALSRLLKANNFPEFTGRVCPAPCEKACICGIYGDAVTIRIDQCGVRDEPSGDNHLGAVGVVSVVEAVDLLAVGDAVAVRVRIVLVEFERDAVEQHEMVLVPVGDAVAVAVGLDVDELADVLVDAGQCIGVLGKIGFASGLAGEYLHPSFEI